MSDIIMAEKGRSGLYNETPYRSMLDVALTSTAFQVRRSYYGIPGKIIIDVPLETITRVSLRRSIIMLFVVCVEVEWNDMDNQRKTLLFGSFKKRAWLAAFSQVGVNVLPQQQLRS